LLKGILSEWVSLAETSKKKVSRILVDAARGRAVAAGEAVEEAPSEEPAAAEGEFPWHDEALTLEERMKLASGKGLFEQLYAAMAQTDCTACGYDCEGYSRAIADGEDDDLTKCAPGELETQETLEKLMGKK
jgi:sulfite reductase (NADPH) flavoprotein alpha-component